MATVDINKNMNGIATNPGLILYASEYSANEGQLVTGTSYLNGSAIRGTNMGQLLMKTPWLSAGTLNNLVMVTAYLESDGTNRVENIGIRIFKRQPNSSEITSVNTITINYNSGISDTIGAIPYANRYASPALQSLWFDPRYEYKFEVFVNNLTAGKYIDLEGLYLQYQQGNSFMDGTQTQFSTNFQVQSIPLVEGIFWSAAADGAGKIDWILTITYIDSTTGSITSSGRVGALFNSISGIVTQFAAGATIPTAATIKSASVIDATYTDLRTAEIFVEGLTAGTTYYFYTIIRGWQNAMVV